MHCPRCEHANLPGVEHCSKCLFDLAALDLPVPQDRVEASLMNDCVTVLNPKTPVTVHEDALLADALERMIDRGVGAVLVTDAHHRLVGILTERDIVARSAAHGFERRPVREIMTADPETLEATETLAAAVRKMNAGNYRHLPITRDGRPVGVISVRDILRHVVKMCAS